MGLRAWLARPIILHLAAIERHRIMTNDQVLAQLASISAGIQTIGDGVVALKEAGTGTSPEVDAALSAVATGVANIVSILPAPAAPAA
jgi:hypothetical protein